METSSLVCVPVVKELLTKENYMAWCVWIRNYLLGQDLWDVVENLAVPSIPVSKRKNFAALHAIQMSCGPEALALIMNISSAKLAWDALTNKYMPPIGSSISEIAPGGTFNNSISGEHYVPLHKAVQRGDWKAASEFLKAHPEEVTGISKLLDNRTVLHSAVLSGDLHIVEELVKLMSKQDMELQDGKGNTALAFAARFGTTEMVECMVKKNENPVLIHNKRNFIPVTLAVLSCNLKMVRYLYSVTPLEELAPERGYYGAALLNQCLRNSNLLDLALDLLQRYPKIAITPDNQGETPVFILANKPSLFRSGSHLLFWQRWIYERFEIAPVFEIKDIRINITESNARQSNDKMSKIPGIKKIYELNLTHVLSLELLRLACNEIDMLNNDTQLSNFQVYDSILKAAENGIPEFIIEAVKAYPELQWSYDKRSLQNLFFYAVKYRQAKVFSLIYWVPSKNVVVSIIDNYGNNLLHMTGILHPSAQLDRISGAALQMQRELQWRKEVEDIMKPSTLEVKNHNRMTARELFTKTHKDLVKEGEKWMKETASSCTVVGALIVTIMFAAAFTVPGGNDQNTGYPMFQNLELFKLFIISDGVSLFSSTTSVLMFLGILTSRYAEDDFLKSLPTKLIIGLSMLFISIAAMMITFSAAISIMFPGRLWIIIPMILFASVPVGLFVWLQFPLLVEIYISTYGPGIFDRTVKPWP